MLRQRNDSGNCTFIAIFVTRKTAPSNAKFRTLSPEWRRAAVEVGVAGLEVLPQFGRIFVWAGNWVVGVWQWDCKLLQRRRTVSTFFLIFNICKLFNNWYCSWELKSAKAFLKHFFVIIQRCTFNVLELTELRIKVLFILMGYQPFFGWSIFTLNLIYSSYIKPLIFFWSCITFWFVF